uniref:G_PROTEIN_RECEP_F1_2 domain-containing protein n=1 Tax=Strongyloides venezuelensis TaxID=75913 RepID=A0A0K0EXP9_STRVS
MSRTATMNIRLKVLLINFAISGLINIVTRYLSIAWYLSESRWFPENGIWYQIIFRLHDLCVVMLTINPVVIAIERISATIFSKSYEDFNNTICNYTLRLSSWIFSVMLMCAFYFIDPAYITLCIIIILISLNSITFIIFAIIFYVNKRKFLNEKKEIRNSLSHKYQIAENIRTSRMLAIFVGQVTIVQIILQSILILIYFYFFPRNMVFEKELMSNVFDIINALFLTTFPFPILLSHIETKKLFCRIFKRTTAKISTNNPKNVFGKDIIIHNANHDNIGMLQDMWK